MKKMTMVFRVVGDEINLQIHSRFEFGKHRTFVNDCQLILGSNLLFSFSWQVVLPGQFYNRRKIMKSIYHCRLYKLPYHLPEAKESPLELSLVLGRKGKRTVRISPKLKGPISIASFSRELGSRNKQIYSPIPKRHSSQTSKLCPRKWSGTAITMGWS